MIETKDILEWCFVLGALILGAYGFLFNSYVTAVMTIPKVPAPVRFLRHYCRVLCGVLAFLVLLSIYSGFTAKVGIGTPAWLIVASLAVVSGYTVMLTIKLG